MDGYNDVCCFLSLNSVWCQKLPPIGNEAIGFRLHLTARTAECLEKSACVDGRMLRCVRRRGFARVVLVFLF